MELLYSEDTFKILIERLNDLQPEPIKALEQQSGLTRPTITKFLSGALLRKGNQMQLLECTLKLIEEGQKKRKELIQRGRRIIQTELEFEQEKQLGS